MPRYEHMTWCVGVHESDGWTCLLSIPVGEGGQVYLTGLPCDSQQFQIDVGVLVTNDEISQLVVAVEQLRAPFAAGRLDADCEHYHNLDDDGNDHVEGCPALWEQCPTCGDEWDCDTCRIPAVQCKGECLP